MDLQLFSLRFIAFVYRTLFAGFIGVFAFPFEIHRRDAESAEIELIFLLSAEWPESKKTHPPDADYSLNSFTIRTMPSFMTGTLKFKINPKVRPDNFR